MLKVFISSVQNEFAGERQMLYDYLLSDALLGRFFEPFIFEKLKQPHASFPANPLLAEPMYLAGYIERMGTGIPDMIKSCLDAGLKEPELIQQETFSTILWRKSKSIPVISLEVGEDITQQVTQQVRNLVKIHEGVKSREELQEMLGLRDRENFRKLYINEAIALGLIEMTIPEKPNDPNQKYRLTAKGKVLQYQLKIQKKK